MRDPPTCTPKLRLGVTEGKRVRYRSNRFNETQAMPTTIPASEAKAKFSELLDHVRGGESSSITLHGAEAAQLVPAGRPSLEQVRRTIADIKASRSLLNPRGLPKLRVKDLINEGRR